MDSFQAFMESLVRSSRGNVTTKHLVKDVRKSCISIKDSVCSSIEESKNVPTSEKRIIKDKLFYKTIRNLSNKGYDRYEWRNLKELKLLE